MRAHPADYELVAPGQLSDVLSLMASEPGRWLPIAGGTDLMVQYSAGKLSSRTLVSIWNLPELRRIEVAGTEIQIGAGCTYTDLRRHELVCREFPLLGSAARWTGGIANQNRGTIGGNIVNASPAADSLPALLVYEAELALVSARGERRLPYAAFHTGYRKTQLGSDELIRAACLKRRFSEYYPHWRKVGARNAQAISKVCLAALGKLTDGMIEDVRLGMGSVAPVPLRLHATERMLMGNHIDAALVERAKRIAASEIQPIDDMRSSARYRAAVAGNLLAEFLLRLNESGSPESQVLSRWNTLPVELAAEEILPCCGSRAWAARIAALRPLADQAALVAASDTVWSRLTEEDWLEAFRSHPRIGDSHNSSSVSGRSESWSSEEQRNVSTAGDEMKRALAEGNRAYEERFGRIFIVCATGKSASDMLEILQRRLNNSEQTELRETAEQQRRIIQARLKKWLRP